MPVVGAEATAVTWVAPGLFVSGWSTGILMVARIDRPDPKDWAKFWELPVLEEKVAILALHHNGSLLAISSTTSVSVWLAKDSKFKVLSFFADVPAPKSHGNVAGPVEITSVSWKGMTTTLVVSYLHHGIVGWDVSTQSIVFAHAIENAGGSLSPNGELFAAFSRQGTTVYALPHGLRQQSFNREDSSGECGPAIFIHNGWALLEGRRGSGIIWDLETSRLLGPDISLEEGENVVCLAQHYDEAGDVFLIAITTSSQRLQIFETHRIGETGDHPSKLVRRRHHDFCVLAVLFSLGAAVTPAMCRMFSE
ncbi:hypothetical protein PC9H_008677 [Pleurotus ostreatus]|uniref:Uncharacterized protein n=1 Tax=Pleurotus ostreatus TaxID=5322 RepID=A0A8H6ZS35_PLEOS|nr:uncharacterized protein PC9H_008677 [Pleurotus ostreatus]KAF7426309.1 hypothetical protein PC9H_008677 [Pleurotus ostreatus]